jgi:hypothetical protein
LSEATDLGPLPKLRFADAEQLCLLAEPSEDARALITQAGELSARNFIAQLADAGLFSEALRYLAIALPRREAVWWACMAGKTLLPAELPAAELTAWRAAETWVYKPTEQHRRAADAPAEALRFGSAGAYAALGVFWSGGSLAPPETNVVVPPGDGLTGSAVGASVLLCCVPGPAKSIPDRQARALLIGANIGNGGDGQLNP